jgi:hypothetical protein
MAEPAPHYFSTFGRLSSNMAGVGLGKVLQKLQGMKKESNPSTFQRRPTKMSGLPVMRKGSMNEMSQS